VAEPQNPQPPTPSTPAPPTPVHTTAAVSSAGDTSQQSERAKADRTNDPTQDALREAAEKLRAALPTLAAADKPLAQAVERLMQRASDPVSLNQNAFQLAYLVQDVGKIKGVDLALSGNADAVMSKLAASAPGLENEHARDLLRSTATLEDRGLIREIRRTAANISQQPDQDTPTIRSQIEVLENRTRLAQRVEPRSETSHQSDAQRASPTESAPERPRAPDRANSLPQDEGARRNADASRPDNSPIVVQSGSGLDTFFRALRGNAASSTAPWDPATQPFGARLSAFENKLAQGRDDIALRGVEKSARAALEALDGFRNGEGAVMLNRIREAARTDPGGMSGVLSEMREGGKFADLRQQFNNALADEKGFSAAYDQAANALARYSQDRSGAEQIIARRPDATNLSAKFETMDREIGQAAGEIPSRRDGKSMIEDISKQVAEMVQRAVDTVKAFFTRSPSQQPSGPSPG
jgi:hypothetical protein